MKKKTQQKPGFNGYVYNFSVDVNDIINIKKYLMEKHDIKWCLDLLKKCLLDYLLG